MSRKLTFTVLMDRGFMWPNPRPWPLVGRLFTNAVLVQQGSTRTTKLLTLNPTASGRVGVLAGAFLALR